MTRPRTTKPKPRTLIEDIADARRALDAAEERYNALKASFVEAHSLGSYTEGGVTVRVTAGRKTLNKVRAFELYGDRVTEPQVTTAAVKANLSGNEALALYDTGAPVLSLHFEDV